MAPEPAGSGLSGRIALVSGGGRGIGRAVSLALGRDGADVALSYRRDADAAEATVGELTNMGCRARAYRASVENEAEVSAMVDAVQADLGPVGILVNNAGIASRGNDVVGTDPDEVARVVGIHAFGSFQLCKLVVPPMRELGRGDVVMISSVATRHMGPNSSPYNMAKAAMEALALTLAKEEGRHGIRVNVVAPGLVETEMGRRLVRGAMGLEDIRQLYGRSPFGRVCQPEDVAEVVRFLVCASYISGQVVAVDGGA